MGERKVLNKYYPPDFDPAKIPRAHKPKNEQFKVRLMAPFNMRCVTCGVFIYKATKFNARKETVEGEEYLGIKIFRFYIRCQRCHQEITFKTDPQNADYVAEHGATRNFEIWSYIAKETEKEQKKKEEEELGNSMKALENRTKQSKREMDLLDSLEEIKHHKARLQAVDVDDLLKGKEEVPDIEIPWNEEDEDKLVESIFGNSQGDGPVYKRLDDESGSDDDVTSERKKRSREGEGEGEGGPTKATDSLLDGIEGAEKLAKLEDKKIDIKQLIKKKPLVLGISKKNPPTTSTPPANVDKTPTGINLQPNLQPNSGLSLIGDYGSSSESD